MSQTSERERMKRRSYSNAWQLLFSPEAVAPFLIGSLMMAVAGNALYELLTNLLGTSSKAVVGIGLSALLILGGAVLTLKHLLRLLRVTPPQINKERPAPHKGLILLVSNEEICWKSIEWHLGSLKHCWLLFSPKSQATAEKLEEELSAKNVRAKLVFIEDVFDPLEFKQKVEDIFAALPNGYTESDVILDFIGMTSCASVGSVMACLDERRHKQYTPGVYDPKLQAVQPLDPVEIKLHWGLLRLSAPAASTVSPQPPQIARRESAKAE